MESQVNMGCAYFYAGKEREFINVAKVSVPFWTLTATNPAAVAISGAKQGRDTVGEECFYSLPIFLVDHDNASSLVFKAKEMEVVF